MSTALVLGIDSNIALAAGRSLRRHGVRVIGVAMTNDAIGLWSRCFQKKYILCNRDPSDPASFVDAVFRIAKNEGCDTLMTPSENRMRLLNRHRDQAPRGLRFCFPAEAVLERVVNKGYVVSVAQEVGLNVPHTACASGAESLRSISNTVRYPVMLKFANVGKRPSGTTWHFKSLYVESAAEINKLAAFLPESEDSLLVQEYAVGRYESLGIAISRKKVVAAFQWAALREYEAGLGGFRVSLPVDEFLLAKSASLLNSMEYEGVAEVEFRYNQLDRKYTLMEVNPRLWGGVALPIACGVDFPWLSHCIAMQEALSPITRYAVGQYSRNLSGDVGWFLKCLRGKYACEHQNIRVSRTQGLRQFLAGLWRTTVFDQERLDDLGPLLWSVRNQLRRFCRSPST